MKNTFLFYAIPQFTKELEREIRELNYNCLLKQDGFYLCESEDKNPSRPIWVQDIWSEMEVLSYQSIKEATTKLKAIYPFWYSANDSTHYRRSKLIEESLKGKVLGPIDFLGALPKKSPRPFYLLNEKEMMIFHKTQSSFPFGKIEFIEDKKNPPGRAYLKLWEFLTLSSHRPQKEDICLDLGSSPGGWSWVLHSLCHKVISVDKAPLASHIADIPNIEMKKESAFSLKPSDFNHCSWLFSDIICYPEKLYETVSKWLQESQVKNFVCTIKLQGETNFDIIKKFQKIPNSHVIHLYHNKHELTWFLYR